MSSYLRKSLYIHPLDSYSSSKVSSLQQWNSWDLWPMLPLKRKVFPYRDHHCSKTSRYWVCDLYNKNEWYLTNICDISTNNNLAYIWESGSLYDCCSRDMEWDYQYHMYMECFGSCIGSIFLTPAWWYWHWIDHFLLPLLYFFLVQEKKKTKEFTYIGTFFTPRALRTFSSFAQKEARNWP